ncbi:MAG: hypothetical protein AAFQ21_16360 [Pseudomonadota bacterium]
MHLPVKLNPIAALCLYGGLALVVLSFLIVSGVANIVVWWNSAEGWARYVFTTVGLGAEVWGALGLLLMTLRFFQGQWLKGAICAALWLPALAFNGYSTYRFFVIQGAEIAQEGEIDQTAQSLAQSALAALEVERASVIARNDGTVPRPLETIDAAYSHLDPDRNPVNMARKGTEEGLRREYNRIQGEIAAQRAILLDKAGADLAPGEKTISDNRVWIGLVAWMEAIKALALWVMFGRTGRPQDAVSEVTTQTTDEPVAALLDDPTPTNVRLIRGPDGEERQVRVL